MTVLGTEAIGSIPRFTALRDYADLDILVHLHGMHFKDRLPSRVLLDLRTALGQGPESLRRDGQAVVMTFASWPRVDVVPGYRAVDRFGNNTDWFILDMNREVLLPTNPERHSQAINAAAGERGEKFRRVIKILKDWNRRQPVRLQSYHIEVIALQLLATIWTDHSRPLMDWFSTAQSKLQQGWYCNQDVAAFLRPEQVPRVLGQLQAAGGAACNAWDAVNSGNHQGAVTTWRSVFGQRFPSYG